MNEAFRVFVIVLVVLCLVGTFLAFISGSTGYWAYDLLGYLEVYPDYVQAYINVLKSPPTVRVYNNVVKDFEFTLESIATIVPDVYAEIIGYMDDCEKVFKLGMLSLDYFYEIEVDRTPYVYREPYA